MTKELEKELIKAVICCQIDKIRELLEEEVNVDAQDEDDKDGLTALAWASKFGYIEIVKVLLDAGANIEAKGTREETALILAARAYEIETAKFLIAKGADITYLLKQYGAMITREEKEKRKQELMAKELKCKQLKQGGRKIVSIIMTKEEELREAAYNNNIAKVEELLEAGVNPDAQDKGGWTVLMRASNELFNAIRLNKIDKVKKLIEAGVDVNTKDEEGYTVLMCASYHGQVEIVKLLIEKGADINAQDEWGHTALSIALDKEYTEIADLLKQHGAIDE